ncbi:universal stress protein [Streptomyces sp. NBC_00103]|uniref:universal stress protein n=1 Tax=Streptomyces sp. NBC_00103 TaxID=2975653 RepID=UPI002253939E|nr:universal stress protein [Streptomyces sp. NBC_00103]MCX5370112.1 universal stress protein [Streptomyces sp. NBC_00103]
MGSGSVPRPDCPVIGCPCSRQAAGLRRQAGERLIAAVDTAFGGAGPGVPFQGLVVRSTPGPAPLEVADRAGDLLVVGAGSRGWTHRALRPAVARYRLARAVCAVLAVPPSPLAGDLTSLHRRVGFRLPLDTGELTDGTS